MKPVALVLLLLLSLQISLYSQGHLSGRIIDKSGLGLPGVNISVKNHATGTISNEDGYFFLELENGSFTLVVSSVGFTTRQVTISVNDSSFELKDIILVESTHIMNEVVISGTRTERKISEAPAAIDLITSDQFENYTGSPEELFALQKGVDFARIGNFQGSISIRGFNSAFNQKLLFLDDNRISNIRIRTPVGPMSAFIKEDIERVEILLGPSSALYGPNCLNGLFNTISKSPFLYPGTDVVLGAGSNELLNVRMRHARNFNNKWAYKVTFEYLSGVEDDFTDSVYIESQGAQVGKAEVGLDRNTLFLKGVASAFYRVNEKTEAGITYAFNLNNSLSVGSRNNIMDWYNASLQFTYKSPHWYAQFYKTWIKLGQSVNTQLRTSNYYMLLNQGNTEEDAYSMSVTQPRKATIEDNSYRYNGEVQFNTRAGRMELVTGIQYQKEFAFTNHTYLLDENGPIRQELIGVYGQIIYPLSDSGIKLIATARADDHSLFGFNFLPKTGITYTKNNSTWRLTYGEGYSTPTVINTYFTAAGGNVLGNSDGFTRSDGTKVDPIKPETLQTLEIGYKSIFFNRKFFLDADVYHNWAENLISPIINLVPQGTSGGPVITHRGDRPITDFTSGINPDVFDPGAFISSNINFGKARTYGFDIGTNYYFSDNIHVTLNYSFFDYYLDRNDVKNDANADGKVDDNDLSINTPKNKVSSAINVSIKKFQWTVFTRWVQKYDFFSGRTIAASTDLENIYNGTPVIEDQVVGLRNGQFNYGQLGGFYLSLNGNYQLTHAVNIGIYANNILGSGNYEFISAPPTQTTIGAEIKVSLL